MNRLTMMFRLLFSIFFLSHHMKDWAFSLDCNSGEKVSLIWLTSPYVELREKLN